MALAGAPWWSLLLAAALFAASTRGLPGLALVAWVPAAALVPAPTLLSLPAALALLGAGLCAAPWWPVPLPRASVPLAAGLAVVAALLASPLALTAAASDVAVGIQASGLGAGALVGYAWLTRPAGAGG